MEPPTTISLRECIAPYRADLSRGIRVVMQSAHETSVRAFCKRPTGKLHIVALGDSVMWGQGLEGGYKFASGVKYLLQGSLQGPRRSVVQEPYIFAHSGATLGRHDKDSEELFTNPPDDLANLTPPQELPLSYPSIPRQLEMAKSWLSKKGIDHKEVDLVLLNGGINDVEALNIINPFKVAANPFVSRDEIRELTRQKLELMRKAPEPDRPGVLAEVLTAFPEAKVVIPNYFQIISTETDLRALYVLLLFFYTAAIPVVTAALRDDMAWQAEAFNLEWTERMGSIIEELHTTRPELHPERISLVDVQIGGRNAYGAEDTFLWELGLYSVSDWWDRLDWDLFDLDQLVTKDQVEDARRWDCDHAEDDVPFYCGVAAAFHPNVAGANRYRDTIMNGIRSRGWIEEWQGGRWTPTFLEMSASMEPMPQEEGWLGQWTGKILAREIQPPHSPVRATVVISRNGEVIKREPANTEFSWTFSRRIIIDKKPHIQTDSVTVQAPYTKSVVVVSGGTKQEI